MTTSTDNTQPNMIEYKNGDKAWFLNGSRHRADGPAVIRSNGITAWWQFGIRHRIDGPAIEYKDGRKSWYLNDTYYGFDDWLYKNAILSEEEKIMLKLQYG
jgi:hypothetical protein